MPAKRDYAVGRGKPPAHTRFQKGQSGNPGGKPGAAKSFQRRLKDAIDVALETSYYELDNAPPDDALERIANRLVLNAARGEARAVKTLLAFAEKFDATAVSEKAPDTTTAGEQRTGEPQSSSLSQGKTQGSFENDASADEVAQNNQDVDAAVAIASGNMAGTNDTVAPPPNAAQKRPTITIAGEVVQQGD
jgi:hypothetical protein